MPRVDAPIEIDPTAEIDRQVEDLKDNFSLLWNKINNRVEEGYELDLTELEGALPEVYVSYKGYKERQAVFTDDSGHLVPRATTGNGRVVLSNNPRGTGVWTIPHIQNVGADLILQGDAAQNIDCFSDAASGETPDFTISGFRAGDAQRTLSISISSTANDRVEFTGLSEYYFSGAIIAGGLFSFSVTAGITASAVQAQGQQPLVSTLNEVTTVASDNDVVTMPAASAGMFVWVVNTTLRDLQIYPASGDNFFDIAANTSITLESNYVGGLSYNETHMFAWAKDSTEWHYLNNIVTGFGPGDAENYYEIALWDPLHKTGITYASGDGFAFELDIRPTTIGSYLRFSDVADDDPVVFEIGNTGANSGATAYVDIRSRNADQFTRYTDSGSNTYWVTGVDVSESNAYVIGVGGDLATDPKLKIDTSGNITYFGNVLFSYEAGITASAVQAQGQQPLTQTLNEVTTVASDNDVVTMPAASAGMFVWVTNVGANDLQVYPASGDNFRSEAVDASITLSDEFAGGQGIHMLAYAADNTTWEYLPNIVTGYSENVASNNFRPALWSDDSKTRLTSADSEDFTFNISNGDGVNVQLGREVTTNGPVQIMLSNTGQSGDQCWARLGLYTKNNSSGDPYIQLSNAENYFSAGIDIDDGGVFSITPGQYIYALGTGGLSVDTTGQVGATQSATGFKAFGLGNFNAAEQEYALMYHNGTNAVLDSNRVTGGGAATVCDWLINVGGTNKVTIPNAAAFVIITDDATYAPLRIAERSAAPTTPALHDIYLDDGTNTASGNPGWRRYNAGAAWEDISAGASTTLNNNTDNYLVTMTGIANTLNGEANLTFDGSAFLCQVGTTIDGSADEIQLKIQGHSTQTSNIFEIEDSSGNDLLAFTNNITGHGQEQLVIHNRTAYNTNAVALNAASTGNVGFGFQEAGTTQGAVTWSVSGNYIAFWNRFASVSNVQLRVESTGDVGWYGTGATAIGTMGNSGLTLHTQDITIQNGHNLVIDSSLSPGTAFFEAGGGTYAAPSIRPAAGTNVPIYTLMIPRGSPAVSTKSQFSLFGTDYVADSTNWQRFNFRVNTTEIQLLADKGGTGSYLPIEVKTGNTVVITSTAAGKFQINSDQIQDSSGSDWITSDGALNTTLAGNLVVSGTGPHAIGLAALGRYQLNHGGAFSSDGSSTRMAAHVLSTSLTAANGDTDWQTGMQLNANITTQSNNETIADVCQLKVNEPNITIGTDTITNASTLLITGAPTEGTNNYAILVDSGVCRFNGRSEFPEGLNTEVSTNNVSDPPTDAELDTAFGTPAALGAGFVGIVDDNSADTDVWLCYTSDTSWFYLQGTKAT